MHHGLPRTVLDEAAIRRTLSRIAHEIIEKNGGAGNLALVGVVQKGDFLAARLARAIAEVDPGAKVPVGSLDITLYRDDLGRQGPTPVVRKSEIPFDVTGMTVILVDDVIYTGRTTRAALEALHDLGRPRAIRFVALVDRGHREVPIQPDHVGVSVETRAAERVKVELKESGAKADSVLLMEAQAGWVPGED